MKQIKGYPFDPGPKPIKLDLKITVDKEVNEHPLPLPAKEIKGYDWGMTPEKVHTGL